MKNFCRYCVLVVFAVFVLRASVFAETYTYSDFVWQEAVAPIFTLSERDFSSSQTIAFEGVATSSGSGTFNVELQKKNVFGVWITQSNVYTVNQHSNYTYNLRTGSYVVGQFFRLYWPQNGAGAYRIRLTSPSSPQVTGITQILFWSY